MVPGTRNTGLGEMLEALELPTVEYMQFASADPDVMLNACVVAHEPGCGRPLPALLAADKPGGGVKYVRAGAGTWSFHRV